MSATAIAQTVGNAGFENPALGNNPFIYDPATGPAQQWTFQQNSGGMQTIQPPFILHRLRYCDSRN
jgi:hypothetical protein